MASRTAILRGPAIVQFNAQDFFSKGDIEVEIDEETFEIVASAYGKVDERQANRVVKVRFEPAGEWEALAVLYPYPSTVVGASIFTGTDVPLVIQTLDGKKLTLSAAAVTKMPDLTLSAVKTAFGQVEFTGIGKDNTPWATANSLITIASLAFPASTFDPTNVKTAPWSAAWGIVAPWDAFQCKEGFNVSFSLGLGRLDTDTDGLVDMMFEKLDVVVKAVPIVSTGGTPGGITEQQILDGLALQGAGAARGKSLLALANNADLALTATGQIFTLKKAAMKGAGYKFGATTVRAGEVAWVATRSLAAGVVGPTFAIS